MLVRKRLIVLLHSGELAAEVFYCGTARETDFLAKSITTLIAAPDEVDRLKFREAAHHESILALALKLERSRNQ
jgi:hypothetical protein